MTPNQQDSDAANDEASAMAFKSEEQRASEDRAAAFREAQRIEREDALKAKEAHDKKVAAEAKKGDVVEEVRTEAHDEADRALEAIHADEARRAEELERKNAEAVSAEEQAAEDARLKEEGRKTNEGLHARVTELESRLEALHLKLRGFLH